MRDAYWAMYTTFKHKEQYFQHYSLGTKRINGSISCFLLVVSVSGIGYWAIWTLSPFSWIGAGVAALAQVVQVLNQYHFPFSKQDAALRYLQPQLSGLLRDVGADWIKIQVNEFDDRKIAQLITKHKERYATLDEQYTSDLYIPLRARCDKKAEIDCRRYFSNHYNAR